MKKIICIAFLLFNCSNAISDNKKTHGLGVPLTSNEMNAISKIKEMVLEFIGKSRTIEPPFSFTAILNIDSTDVTLLPYYDFDTAFLQGSFSRKNTGKVLSCQMTCILPFQKMDV